MTDRLSVGVVGVGSMGRNHARVYRELPSAELVGVADADAERAREVADAYDTQAISADRLFWAVDAVSIAVPTRYHYEAARRAIKSGVDVLVEKPFVERPEHGERLIELAGEHDPPLQVGHVERFNPAIRTLSDVLPALDVIAIDARRLGPPVDRDIDVNPVLDLMIHDIDIARSIADGEVTGVRATRSNGDPYVTASLGFDTGVVATLTASRATQRKVRTLSVTARECQVEVDYIDQTVEIHRQSFPEYVEHDGDVRYRHQNVVERPTVQNGEPLKAELEAFLDAAATGSEPVVTGADGLEALRIANRITEAAATADEPAPTEVRS
jgi:predicted dehydrogenase